MIVAEVKVSVAQTAEAGDAFTVRGIQIDVTAESAKAARDNAFKQAQEKSLPVLFQQLEAQGYKTQGMKTASAKEIASAIKDFEISNEKISAVRYKGDFVFRYDEALLSQYFYQVNNTQQFSNTSGANNRNQAHGIKHGTKGGTLVLPFFKDGNKSITLWDGYNPWKDIWASNTTRAIMTPIGDLSDIRDISSTQSQTYNPENLARMAQRYGVDRIVVLIGTQRTDRFQASLYDTARGRPDFIGDINVDASAYPTAPQRLQVGYNRALEMIYKLQPVHAIGSPPSDQYAENRQTQEVLSNRPSSYVSTNTGVGGPTASFQGRIEYTSMQEWLRSQKTLRRVRGVTSLDVLSLTPTQAEVKVQYQGAFDSLATAMMDAGYNIQPTSKAGRYQIYSSRRSVRNQNGGVVYR